MLKYATINVILTRPSLSNNCSMEVVEVLGLLKLSCNLMWKSLAEYANSFRLL